MRKSIFTIVILFSIFSIVLSSCEKDSPDDEDNNPQNAACFDYIDLAAHIEAAGKTIFINADEGWIIGNPIGVIGIVNGVLIHTEDGGASWSIINDDLECALENIQFYNSTDGYMVDDNSGVQYTTDKGATWTGMSIPNPNNNNINIYATASNGANTVLLASTDNDNSLLFFVDNFTHNVTSNVLIPDMKYPGRKMHLSTNGTINIAVAERNGLDKKEIAHSSDNGATWTYTEMPGDGPQGYVRNSDFSFPDDNTGYYTGWDNQYGNAYIYKTTNGGANWNKIDIPESLTGYNFNQMDFADAQNGLAIGNSSVYKTTDGAASWTEFTCFSDNYISIFSVSFPDATHGFLTGLNGADVDFSSRTYLYTGQ